MQTMSGFVCLSQPSKMPSLPFTPFTLYVAIRTQSPPSSGVSRLHFHTPSHDIVIARAVCRRVRLHERNDARRSGAALAGTRNPYREALDGSRAFAGRHRGRKGTVRRG